MLFEKLHSLDLETWHVWARAYGKLAYMDAGAPRTNCARDLAAHCANRAEETAAQIQYDLSRFINSSPEDWQTAQKARVDALLEVARTFREKFNVF